MIHPLRSECGLWFPIGFIGAIETNEYMSTRDEMEKWGSNFFQTVLIAAAPGEGACYQTWHRCTMRKGAFFRGVQWAALS